MKSTATLSLILLFFACTTHKKAQTVWHYKASDVVISTDTSVYFIHAPHQDSLQSIRMTDAYLNINISGQWAHHRLDFYLKNTSSEPMEAEFILPLPEGSQVNEMALDIDGKMREAVIVEKEKGRVVFEEISRYQKDPGLLEKTDENLYRLRVFPIPAGGTRHVQVGYDQLLRFQGDAYIYHLPFQLNAVLKQMMLHFEISDMQSYPSLQMKEGWESVALEFNKGKKGLEADYLLKDHALHHFYFALNPYEFQVEPLRGTLDDKLDIIAIPIAGPGKIPTNNRTLPEIIQINWDASASVDSASKARLLSFLETSIHQNPNIKWDLQLLQVPIPALHHELSGAELIQKIKDTPQDGASVFVLNPDIKSKEVWYLGDGKINYSNDLNDFPVPVYTISANPLANHGWMKKTAQESKGNSISLSQHTPEEAMQVILSDPLRILNIEGAHPSFSKHLIGSELKDGWLMVPVDRQQKRIEIDFGNSEFHQSLSYSTYVPEFSPGPIIRQWLTQYIAWEEAGHPNKEKKDALLALSQQHHFVSKGASLLVLDSLEQYLDYKIPPADPEMLARYQERIDTIHSHEAVDLALHKATVLRTYQENRKRYLMRFDQKKKPEKIEPAAPTERNIIDPNNPDDAYDGSVNETEQDDNDGEIISFSDSVSVTSEWAFGAVSSNHASPPPIGYNAEGNYTLTFSTNGASRYKVNPDNTGVDMKPFIPESAEYQSWIKLDGKALYQAFLKNPKRRHAAPALYMDLARLLHEKGNKDLAYRVLSNLAEMEVESPELLRVLGKALMEYQDYDQAVFIFKQVLEMKSEEPQSYRDLALAEEGNGNYQQAFDHFAWIVNHSWDVRFPEIEQIAIEEAQHVWNAHKNEVNPENLDEVYHEIIPKDLRIVIDWDKDLCDIDLWVTDTEKKEKCFYGHRFASDGGTLSKDFLRGYGPEVYQIGKNPKSPKTVKAHYFSQSANRILGETIIRVRIYRNYGTANETMQEQNVRLANKGNEIYLADLVN